MAQIAILGYGVVGSGIYLVHNQNRKYIEKQAGCEISVKRVLDKRDFSSELGSVYTSDFEDIINDDEIQIVAEVMGGIDPAYDFVKRALLKGKHVCTSNKELVAKHGAELLAIAEERDINFLFEASVCGGIPVIRPINLSLTSDTVASVSGILNGTTNYMLTQMHKHGKSYDEALKEAQDLGYAENDPTADVGGFDACRKLAILMSVITGHQVDFEDIPTEGIQNIDQLDFAFAKALGYSIKLMVDGRLSPEGVRAMVAPMLVSDSLPVSAVSGVYNGVIVQARATGDVMFYGQGAGKLPTAGAMISDIVDITKHLHRHIIIKWSPDKIHLLPADSYVKRKMIRMSVNDPVKLREASKGAEIIELPGHGGYAAWITEPETEAETNERIAGLNARVLRVYEPEKQS